MFKLVQNFISLLHYKLFALDILYIISYLMFCDSFNTTKLDMLLQ